MVLAIDNSRTRFETETQDPATPNSLLEILLNRLILDNIIPYISISSLLSLSSTNRDFRSLVYESPGVFRHLDLSNVKRAQLKDADGIDHGGQVWRNVQLDENLTEDEFYSGPLRGIFSFFQRRDVLQDIQTLVLDGLSVTAEFCNDIINDPAYGIRILSIREVKSLNHGKLRGSLQYACRPSRPEGSPRLKAVYVFGSKNATSVHSAMTEQTSLSTELNLRSQRALTTSLECENDAWWTKKGRINQPSHVRGWQDTLVTCKGIIAFDTVLCEGPCHRNSLAFGTVPTSRDTEPALATIALPPCEDCGKCPEGLTDSATSPVSLPLLAPPPILSSTLRAATTPRHPSSCFVARCEDCLTDRYCLACHKWWCETCYVPPNHVSAEPIKMGDNGSDDSTMPKITTLKPKVRNGHCSECPRLPER